MKLSFTVFFSYYLLPEFVSMFSASFLILVNSMLCIVAIYAAIYWSSDVLGFCLLLQSVGMNFWWWLAELAH